MAAMDARDARSARDAMAAMDAMDAIQRFASWCMHRSWWWYSEVSYLATTYLGAVQLDKSSVSAWSKPLFDAFCSGCWILHWTDDTLFWVAKPVVNVEKVNGLRRLHNESYAAIESDLENLYFWHGVLVPAFAVVRPDWITIGHIRNEENAEVRRVLIERMGWDRFCEAAQMKVIHQDTLVSRFPSIAVSEKISGDMRAATSYREGEEIAELLEAEEFTDFDERPLKFVRVTDPSTGSKYLLRVWPENTRAYEAVGQTFGKTEQEYKTMVLQHS
jgi:hypothetical protein